MVLPRKYHIYNVCCAYVYICTTCVPMPNGNRNTAAQAPAPAECGVCVAANAIWISIVYKIGSVSQIGIIIIMNDDAYVCNSYRGYA